VGSILISRISTSLHSVMSTLPSSLDSSDKSRRKPSLKLVIGTLFFVTLPIEVGFLAVLSSVGWLEIPFLLIVFFILFFCVTVRLFPFESPSADRLPCPTLTGRNIALHRKASDEVPLVQRLRPRYVRHASPFRNDGSHWPIATCGLLRAREHTWRESPDRTRPRARPPPERHLNKTQVPDEIRLSCLIAIGTIMGVAVVTVCLPRFPGFRPMIVINASRHSHSTFTLLPYHAYRYIPALESRMPWTWTPHTDDSIDAISVE